MEKLSNIFNRYKDVLLESVGININQATEKDINQNNLNYIKGAELVFQDKEVSDIFYEYIIDVDEYKNSIFTIGDAELGYSDYARNGRGFLLLDSYTDGYFAENDKIIKFPELVFFKHIRKIPAYCFRNDINLEMISIPEDCEFFDDGAFINCTSLKNINFSASGKLRELKSSCFANSGLVNIVIPEGVERIEENVFDECKNLVSVTLPSTIKYIGDCAFADCPNLTTVNGITNVNKFGNDIFYNYPKIRNQYPQLTNSYTFEYTLFDGSWVYEYNGQAKEFFLENYLSNVYDTDDINDPQLKTNQDWLLDEMNPNGENYNEEKFYEKMWEWNAEELEIDWNDLKANIKSSDIYNSDWVIDDSSDCSDCFGDLWEAICHTLLGYDNLSDITITIHDGVIDCNGYLIYLKSERGGFYEEEQIMDFSDFNINIESRLYTDRIEKYLF